MFCSENTAPPRSGLIYVIYLHCSRFLPYDAAEKKSKLLDDMQRLFDSETTEWMLREMAENRDKAKVRPVAEGGSQGR